MSSLSKFFRSPAFRRVALEVAVGVIVVAIGVFGSTVPDRYRLWHFYSDLGKATSVNEMEELFSAASSRSAMFRIAHRSFYLKSTRHRVADSTLGIEQRRFLLEKLDKHGDVETHPSIYVEMACKLSDGVASGRSQRTVDDAKIGFEIWKLLLSHNPAYKEQYRTVIPRDQIAGVQ